jgi:Biotin-lipoyl like
MENIESRGDAHLYEKALRETDRRPNPSIRRSIKNASLVTRPTATTLCLRVTHLEDQTFGNGNSPYKMDTLTKWSATAATKVKPRLTFKQLPLLGLACVAALAGSAYGYHWWTIGRFLESTDDAYVGGNVTPISPHISAFIAEILVTDNQRVNARQVLVRLDDRDVQAAADHAEANLKQHTAMLASLRAKYALQQPAIRQAAADLDSKTAQADFAKARRRAISHPRSLRFRFPAERRKNARPGSGGEDGRGIGTGRARGRKSATKRAER